MRDTGLPTRGNPQARPPPRARGAGGTSPSKSPGGVLLKNRRGGLECPARQVFRAGGQLPRA